MDKAGDGGSSFGRPGSSGSGMTSEQFSQINAKLDKIIATLAELEIVDDEEEVEESEVEEEAK